MGQKERNERGREGERMIDFGVRSFFPTKIRKKLNTRRKMNENVELSFPTNQPKATG
jgi:hypothetical protein